ncbi:MAG: hypothetical protein WBN06_00165, partial [Lysobacterales bacterium]
KYVIRRHLKIDSRIHKLCCPARTGVALTRNLPNTLFALANSGFLKLQVKTGYLSFSNLQKSPVAR